MQELEKILEKIEQRKARAEKLIVKPPHDKLDQVANDTAEAFIEAYEECQDIIRKHMNDGWIPVEERMPEEKKSVLVQWEKYDRHLNVTLTYLDVMWLEDEEDVVFETINGIPNGRVIAWRPLPEPYHLERSEGE